MNRLFLLVTTVVVVLVGGAALHRWEQRRVTAAFVDGYIAGEEKMRKIGLAAVAETYDAAINQASAECAQSAAVRSTIIAEMSADERQRRQFEHERMLEQLPKTIVIGRRCGRLESPLFDDCVR